jgi:hypothetical protein
MSAIEKPALDVATIRAIAREAARLTGPEGGLLTVTDVAIAFNVARGWVYAHADELGAIRLGEGPRPRLRFDPAVVTQRLQKRRGRITASPPSHHLVAVESLLRIGPARSRRTLGGK